MVDFCRLNEPVECVQNILSISEKINSLKDIDAVLDRILTESRRLTNADAGTIYLVEQDNWPDDKILMVISKESGCHFDPEVVDAFFCRAGCD